MKTIIIFFLFLTSLTAFAHEDLYKAIERSNVHIKIQVGYESSWELRIVESYAEIINDFIKEIDSKAKVFIQFSEDYCHTKDDLFFLSYGDFKKFIPDGFPWGYKYDMNYINSQKGINIIIKEKYFSLKTMLQLLEFGLKNKDYVIEKENISKGKRGRYVHRVIDGENWMKYELYNEPESPSTIDSIFGNELSRLSKKYLSKKVTINDIPESLRQKRITISLQNDSVFFIDDKNSILMKLPSFNSIIYDDKTSCFFLFNTNRNFYFFNKDMISNQIQYDLPFETGCSEILIKYNTVISKYELTKRRSIILLDENNNEINKEWTLFDEINGISKM